MATIGRLSGAPLAEPTKGAPPRAMTPPPDVANQYPGAAAGTDAVGTGVAGGSAAPARTCVAMAMPAATRPSAIASRIRDAVADGVIRGREVGIRSRWSRWRVG